MDSPDKNKSQLSHRLRNEIKDYISPNFNKDDFKNTALEEKEIMKFSDYKSKMNTPSP